MTLRQPDHLLPAAAFPLKQGPQTLQDLALCPSIGGSLVTYGADDLQSHHPVIQRSCSHLRVGGRAEMLDVEPGIGESLSKMALTIPLKDRLIEGRVKRQQG